MCVGVVPQDVAATCVELGQTVRDGKLEGWLVQEQVAGGVEMLLGVIRDAQLGLAVSSARAVRLPKSSATAQYVCCRSA